MVNDGQYNVNILLIMVTICMVHNNLVGGKTTILKNMKVNGKDDPIYDGK